MAQACFFAPVPVTLLPPPPYHGAEGEWTMKKHFAVLGGDQRQRQLSRLLRRDGHQVDTWGMEPDDRPEEALALAAPADCVILPLPVTRDGRRLHAPMCQAGLALESLWPALRPGEQLICGGMVPRAMGESLGILDYFAREEVQIANAVPTAEGAVAAAMAATARTLHGAECLVLGYGRIGKVLAHRLQGLGARVAVSARKLTDLAWIDAYGYRGIPLSELAESLPDFHLIFNTVPAPLLTAPLLKRLRAECVILELASAPGGVDAEAAEALGIPLIAAPGLPGKVAPLTAAAVLRDAIYHLLDERGESH